MDFYSLIRTLLRRWYVVLPVVALAAIVTMRSLDAIEPEYEASGTLLLLGPHQRVIGPEREIVSRNPYSEFTASLSTTAGAIRIALTQDVVRDELSERGLSTDYSLSVGSEIPSLEISATSDDPQVAVDTVNALFGAVSTELATRQDAVGVPPEDRIAAQTLVAPAGADEKNVARNRALTSLVVLGILATVSVALLTDTLVARLRAGAHSVRGPLQRRARTPRTPTGAGWTDGDVASSGKAQETPEGAPRPARQPALRGE